MGRRRRKIEEQLQGVGTLSDGQREEKTVPYSLTIWRWMLDVTAINDSSRQEIEGKMDASGSLTLGDAFSWVGSGDVVLTLEDGRKIGIMVSKSNPLSGLCKFVGNGGWVE